MDIEKINKLVLGKVKELFPEDRIICLLRYGPTIKFDGTSPADLDFLLLLDKYNNKDYSKLSSLKFSDLTVEIFIDYKDQIIARGFDNYQRGVHGSYFFKILAKSSLIYGSNFYKENEDSLILSKMNQDLLFRIGEYFYRIQKTVLNSKKINKEEINKTLGRIITDMLLLNNFISFEDMHRYHYSTILFETLAKVEFLDSESIENIKSFLKSDKLDLEKLGEILGILYKKYYEYN